MRATVRRLGRAVPDRLAADAFHRSYYRAADTWRQNTFLGYAIQQCPLDLHSYQEAVCVLKPRFVVQTGVASGGSLLYFASLLDLIGAPKEALVVGVDVVLTERARTLTHPRIRLVEGSSVDEGAVGRIAGLVSGRGMVVLDSDHSKAHVLAELHAYRRFVETLLVVEDTNVNGHPVLPSFGAGPLEAVEEFLPGSGFVRDDGFWCRQKLSFHQGGWLRRTGLDLAEVGGVDRGGVV